MTRLARAVDLTDVALSISYEPSTGLTCGLLLGCSAKQQTYVIQQLKSFAALACHPLLLPVLILEYHRSLITQLAEQLWRRLLALEVCSGQTGAPVLGAGTIVDRDVDYDEITKKALEIIQLSAAFEGHGRTLLLGAESIKESFGHLFTLSNCQDLQYMEDTKNILIEKMGLTNHQTLVLVEQLQYIYKRGQAQMTAVCFTAPRR